MILPSSGETPFGDDDKKKRPAKDKDAAEDKVWWPMGKPEPSAPDDDEEEDDDDDDDDEDEDDDDLDDEEDEDEDDDDLDDAMPSVYSPAGPGWRMQLKRDILACIDDLKEIEDPDQDFDPPEPPDLYTFYGELAALRHELRVSSRRSAQWVEKTGSAIADMAKQLKSSKPGHSKPEEAADNPGVHWPVEVCLALIALHDLVTDLCPVETALVSFEVLFARAGLERVSAKGHPFDPERMTVTSVEIDPAQPPRTVLRETEAGFLRSGVLLRPARVVISG